MEAQVTETRPDGPSIVSVTVSARPLRCLSPPSRSRRLSSSPHRHRYKKITTFALVNPNRVYSAWYLYSCSKKAQH
ncbi:hypothetical protein K1719_002763 [Acacia pycnantha]|nr:hypothetical protein K1719_002763 [Acacia pycnantha]